MCESGQWHSPALAAVDNRQHPNFRGCLVESLKELHPGELARRKILDTCAALHSAKVSSLLLISVFTLDLWVRSTGLTFFNTRKRMIREFKQLPQGYTT